MPTKKLGVIRYCNNPAGIDLTKSTWCGSLLETVTPNILRWKGNIENVSANGTGGFKLSLTNNCLSSCLFILVNYTYWCFQGKWQHFCRTRCFRFFGQREKYLGFACNKCGTLLCLCSSVHKNITSYHCYAELLMAVAIFGGTELFSIKACLITNSFLLTR